MLYGGSSPSGIVNAVSKMPPAEPVRYLETGVNNFGNGYLAFDFGGPAAIPTEMASCIIDWSGKCRAAGPRSILPGTTTSSSRHR